MRHNDNFSNTDSSLNCGLLKSFKYTAMKINCSCIGGNKRFFRLWI